MTSKQDKDTCTLSTVRNNSTFWFSENSFKLACRATVGFLLLSVLVFTQKFYHLEYGPLAIIMFLCSITFSSDQLEYGFVSLGCLQSTASLLFGALFGYIAAWFSGSSNLLTIASAAVGTGLFTALHPYQKISFITSNGEIYFIFNLLDSKKPGGNDILWNTFYETMIGAILAHVTALFVSFAIFPKYIHQEIFRCLSHSFEEAGTVLSKTATLLLRCCAIDQHKSSSWDPFLLQDIQQHWEQAKGYFETTQAMKKCLVFEWTFRYTANQVHFNSLMDEWQSFLDTLQALQILVAKGQGHYSDEILLHWKSFVECLQMYFAWMATKCHRYSMIYDIHNNPKMLKQLWQIEYTQEWQQIRESNVYSVEFHEAYQQYFRAISNQEMSNLSIFDHCPFMYLVVITNALKVQLEALDTHLDKVVSTESCSKWRFFGSQMLSTLEVLAWPFYGWLQVLKGIPKGYQEWKQLLKNNKFQFFLKKWLVSLSILTFLLASPFYEQFASFNGAWLWLSYILYMQPSTEGTLMNGIANIVGVFFACLASALLMLRPFTATNGYLLDIYLSLVTFVTVVFLTSPISETLLSFAFTEYVLILYYFNPYEFHETWRYSLTRFLQILLGIIIAVLINTWILPFSALEETTSRLASLLEKMVSYYALLTNFEDPVVENSKRADQLRFMWKEFSYISSGLESICNGILETTGISVVSKEILTVVRWEEDLLRRLKALVIVSRQTPSSFFHHPYYPFHSSFYSFMNEALLEDWNALLVIMKQLTSLIEHKLTHTEAFRCSEFLKDITQQAQKRVAEVAQETATMSTIHTATRNLLSGLGKYVDILTNNSSSHPHALPPLTSEQDVIETHEKDMNGSSLLSNAVVEQWRKHVDKTENTQDLSWDWMNPSLAKLYMQVLEQGSKLSQENDAKRWLECKRALSGLPYRSGKLERHIFRKSSNVYSSILLKQMKTWNKRGLSQIATCSQLDYQTFPIIQTTWNDRVSLSVQEWKKAQGILYLHCIYLERQFLKGSIPLERQEASKEPLWILYGNDYIYWLARLFTCFYFIEGLVSLAMELRV